LRRLEPIVRRAFRDARVSSGLRVLVAVSGGADSTALLLVLHRLSGELGIDVVAAHLHHGLRGHEADGDQRFVIQLCQRLGLPLVARRWNTRERMRRLGWTGQEGLRRLRRRFLMQAARGARAHFIATAHTADDQMETLLLRLSRGVGLSGLGGTRLRHGRFLRPLLHASRAEIEADLRAVGESWREDSSNRDPAYERNRIRHAVIPAWLGEGAERGALAKRIGKTMAEVRAVTRWLDRQGKAALDQAAVVSSAPGLAFDRSRLATLPDGVLRAALRRAWSSTRSRRGWTRPILHEVLTLVRSQGSGQVDLPGGWVAWGRGDRIGIGPSALRIEWGALQARTPIALHVPGRNHLGTLNLHASWVAGDEARRRLSRGFGGEGFAASHLKGRLELRLGRTDEMFIPFGRTRPRRLGDFLKQSGIPRADRADRMVLADRQGILWVVGVRRSARAPLAAGTRKALWIKART
jgi:tRNA(Ile)-lysidine synthase